MLWDCYGCYYKITIIATMVAAMVIAMVDTMGLLWLLL